jgi:lipoprotein-anchoring transpeptidase ErfK/SrfK
LNTGRGLIEDVMSRIRSFSISIVALIAAGFAATSAQAGQPFNFLSPETQGAPQPLIQQQAALPDPGDENGQLSPRLRRQTVDYASKEAPGTVVVDTPHTFLYYVLGNGKAIRYGIGVGREGFTWSGVKAIVRKTEWPDWYPPPQMVQRQPYLPRMMAGGPGNPLGARAMYIGGTQYRIHGTNNPATIGKHVSSGCIRMTNDNAIDLYNRVKIGAKVIVLPQTGAPTREAKAPAERHQARDWRAEAQAAIDRAREQNVPQHSSYAAEPQSAAHMTWNTIRPSGLY